MSDTSVLPAGSISEVEPGVFVPCPNAAPNEAGAGDPRALGTQAVAILLDGTQVPLTAELLGGVLTESAPAAPAQTTPATDATTPTPAAASPSS